MFVSRAGINSRSLDMVRPNFIKRPIGFTNWLDVVSEHESNFAFVLKLEWQINGWFCLDITLEWLQPITPIMA